MSKTIKISDLSAEPEEVLIELGAIQRRSPRRREILRCLGCRWAAKLAEGDQPQTYGMEIMRCSGIDSGTVYPRLRQLAEVGAVEVTEEPVDPAEVKRPARTLISPADNYLGGRLLALATIPSDCTIAVDRV